MLKNCLRASEDKTFSTEPGKKVEANNYCNKNCLRFRRDSQLINRLKTLKENNRKDN